AKALAYAGDRALVGVHHMEGHLFAPAVEDPDLAPPFVALLVSGGHTLLLDVPAWGQYRLLGATRDDAAGEAFDKVAILLGLGYPGGPPIERLAQSGDPARFTFPRPMLDEGFEFSFSGLKTAVLHAVRASDDLARARRLASARPGRAQRLDPRRPRGSTAAGIRNRRHSAIHNPQSAMTIYPFKFLLGPLTITGYGLMMMVAFLMAGWAIQLDLRQRRMNEDCAAATVIASGVGGT